MSEASFFKKIRSCEATFGRNERVGYYIFSTRNNLFLGVVVYSIRQLKGGSSMRAICEEHFPAKTEAEAIDNCEKWIREKISDSITVSCE